jgi:hypothetical protein
VAFRHCELFPLEISHQKRQGTLEDDGRISVGDRMPQKILRAT